MLKEQINHKESLDRLLKEKYDVDLIDRYVVIKNLPYVNSKGTISYGDLISVWEGPDQLQPKDHKTFFKGDVPCDKQGNTLESIFNSERTRNLSSNITYNVILSNKPASGYESLYHKLFNYINIITSQAIEIDPNATGKTGTHRIIKHDESVHVYEDTAISREQLVSLNSKLSHHKIAIIGLGGTGSYVLDLMSKSPVSTLILIDGDIIEQHNAFRAPGAMNASVFEKDVNKAEYFCSVYSQIHKNISFVPEYLAAENSHHLDDVDFAFVCVDSGESRRKIFNLLHDRNLPFIDVGMGIVFTEDDQFLKGLVRTSLSTPNNRDAENGIDQSSNEEDALYNSNIQVADLNMINASIAVITWKKTCGFYLSDEENPSSIFLIRKNKLL